MVAVVSVVDWEVDNALLGIQRAPMVPLAHYKSTTWPNTNVGCSPVFTSTRVRARHNVAGSSLSLSVDMLAHGLYVTRESTIRGSSSFTCIIYSQVLTRVKISMVGCF